MTDGTIQTKLFACGAISLLLGSLLSCSDYSNTDDNKPKLDTIAIGTVQSSYLLVDSDQGLVAIDPSSLQAVAAFTTNSAPAILIPQYATQADGSTSLLNRFAVFVDNNHLYRVDLAIGSAKSLQAEQVSVESSANQLCSLRSLTSLYDYLNDVRLAYSLSKSNATCVLSPDPNQFFVDNDYREVNLAMSGVPGVENEPKPPPTRETPTPTAAEISGTEHRFFRYVYDENANSLRAQLISRLTLNAGALIWYKGNTTKPLKLLINVSKFSLLNVNFLPAKKFAFLVVDNALYVINDETGALKSLNYSLNNQSAKLYWIGKPDYQTTGLYQYAFFDNSTLQVLSILNGQFLITQLNASNETYGANSKIFSTTDDYIIIFEPDPTGASSGAYYSQPRNGNARKDLQPPGYHIADLGSHLAEISRGHYLMQSDADASYLLVDAAGNTIRDFSASQLRATRSFNFHILVLNFDGNGNSALYLPSADRFDFELGDIAVDLSNLVDDPVVIPISNDLFAFGFANSVYLFDRQLPGQYQVVLPSSSQKQLLQTQYTKH